MIKHHTVPLCSFILVHCYDMDMDALVAFARLQEKRFQVLNAGKMSDTERLYAQTLKLGEEVGEVCEAILAHTGHQRQDKLAQHSTQKLAHELADCVIVLFILADKLGIELPTALDEKVALVDKRFKHVVVEDTPTH